MELAGRDGEIERFSVLRYRAVNGRSAQSMILTGLRGVGKTVLLNEMAGTARLEGWIVAKVEADLGGDRTPFGNQVAQALHSSLRQVRGKHPKSSRLKAALRTFTSFSLSVAPDGKLSVGIDLDPAPGRADTGLLQSDLTDLAVDIGEAAGELGIGVALFVDEMQHLSREELAAVCQACHEAGQRNLPFFVIGAGLPNLPGALAEAKSYAERLFDYVRIGRLSDADAETALVRPAEVEHVSWTAKAARTVLEASGGYPYFIQQFGQDSWDVALDSPINEFDASEGIRIGRSRLDHGFFLARWERAAPAERNYLAAMAIDGDGPSSSGEVARRLDKQLGQLGPVRARLISKGLAYAPEHGMIAFTVPGMADFVRRMDAAS